MLSRSPTLIRVRRELRRRGLVLLLAALGPVLVLGLVSEARELDMLGIDYTVRTLVQAERTPVLDRPMRCLSALGSDYILVPLNLALLGLFLFRGEGWALWVPILTGGAILIEGLEKWSFGSLSGLVTTSDVFFGALLYLLWTSDLPCRWRLLGSGLVLLAVLGIAYSRIYLNEHWFTDVLGGFIGAAAYLVFLVAWIEHRRPPRRRSV